MNIVQQSRKALGSEAHLTLLCDDRVRAHKICTEAWQRVADFESRFSRFLETSELSQLNTRAGEWVSVTQEFVDLLNTAVYFGETTKGIYNPFILPALQRAGYRGSWPNPAKGDKKLDVRGRKVLPSVEQIEVKGLEVRLPADTALDFGGIGKGYLLDDLARFLVDQRIQHFWASLGGDVICMGADPEGNPWEVAIASADYATKDVAICRNNGGSMLAIATSGTVKRRGKGWHHLIDPRTGKPTVTEVLTATVVTRSATAADIFAKCRIIANGEHIYHDEGSILQLADGTLKIDDKGGFIDVA